MLKPQVWLIACAALLCSAPAVMAQTSVTLEAGHSSESDTTYRASMQFDFGRSLWQNQSGSLQLGGYWDAGFTHWDRANINSLSLTPIFQLNFSATGRRFTPFLEGGIGVALFSETRFPSNTDIASSFQFEDVLGAGVRLPSGSELGLRWYHYSNAGIKQPNMGVEKTAVYFRLPF